MKILIYASILILHVNSSCSRRPLTKCLKDEHCQIVETQCRTRPERCKEIDASNPKNCLGTKCYYDEEQKLCKSYESFLSQRYQDQDQRQVEQQEASHSEEGQDEIQINTSTQISENSVNPNPIESNQNHSLIGNSTINSTNLDNDNSQQNITTYKENKKVDYSQQDTIVFEIVDIDINVNELIGEGEDPEKSLFLGACPLLLSTFLIFQLFI